MKGVGAAVPAGKAATSTFNYAPEEASHKLTCMLAVAAPLPPHPQPRVRHHSKSFTVGHCNFVWEIPEAGWAPKANNLRPSACMLGSGRFPWLFTVAGSGRFQQL